MWLNFVNVVAEFVKFQRIVLQEFYETTSKKELCLLLAHRTSQVQKYEVKIKGEMLRI